MSEEGVWLILGKAGGPKTIKAGEALEEALCFGWIDGQMQSLDDKTYRKYFSQRRGKRKWSEKNKQLVQRLEEQGRMTDSGPVSYTHLDVYKRQGQEPPYISFFIKFRIASLFKTEFPVNSLIILGLFFFCSFKNFMNSNIAL